VGHVALDRGVADEQLGGDLGVGQPSGDEPEDLLLPVGEPGNRVGAAGRREPRNCSMTRRVIDGASSASPAATTRTAPMSCSGGALLSRKPLAPAVRAW
jgi:hypothetical protein